SHAALRNRRHGHAAGGRADGRRPRIRGLPVPAEVGAVPEGRDRPQPSVRQGPQPARVPSPAHAPDGRGQGARRSRAPAREPRPGVRGGKLHEEADRAGRVKVTIRLYYDRPDLLTFEGRVVGRREIAGRTAYLLDRSAFYPTSGGQPHDTGLLG